MMVFSRNMASLEYGYNFRDASFDFLVRQKYLEFCQTSHIPRKDHHNRYFCTIL